MAKHDEGYCKDCGYVGGFAGEECPECDNGIKLVALSDGLEDYEKPDKSAQANKKDDDLGEDDDDFIGGKLTDDDLEDDFDDGEHDGHNEISLEEAGEEEDEEENKPGRAVGDDELDEQE